jgi:hypothetical protein
MLNNVSGINNVAVGQSALSLNTASNNTAVGYQSAFANTSGTGITAIGYQALTASTGNDNTAVGYQALTTNTSGTGLTAIGYQATTTADNSIQLGNSNVTSVNTSGTINTSGAVNAKSFNLNSSTAITAATTTTIDLSTSNIFKVSLGADISVLTLNNAKPGTYIIEFIQGASTLYNVTFPSGWKWAAGLVPIVTQSINKIDIVTLVYDGST